MKTAWIGIAMLAGTVGMVAQQGNQPLKKVTYGGNSEVKMTMKKEPIPLKLKDVLTSLSSPEQVFVINPGRDTVLKGMKGTLLYYSGGSLVNEKGEPVSGKVKMKLKESTEYWEMMGDGLSTVTDSGLLETRGMFKLSATDGKQELKLKPGADMTVMVPNAMGNGDMQLWDGVTGTGTGNTNTTTWRSNSTGVTRFQPFNYVNCGWDVPDVLIKKCNFWCRFRKFLGLRPTVTTTRTTMRVRADFWSPMGCSGIDSLISKYKIKNYNQLLRYVYYPLMRQYRVNTLAQLFLKMEQERRKGVEKSLASGNASFQNLNYYVFTTQKLDWKNLDAFYKMPENAVVEQKINQEVQPEMAVSLIIKGRKMIVSAYQSPELKYHYPRLPRHERGTVIAIKVVNGKPMIASHTIKFEGEDLDLQFKEVSMDQLKEEIKKAGL